MCSALRKVEFSLGNYEFHPDATPEERKRMDELIRKRHGYFHRWAEDVDTSKDIPYIKPQALVEDLEDGKLHWIEWWNLRFVSDFETDQTDED